MDKRCAVEITQVANGFVVYPAFRDKTTGSLLQSAMVFDTVVRLADWLAVHFAREEQTISAEEVERARRAMNVAPPWVEGRSK